MPVIAKIEISLDHEGRITWLTTGPPPDQTMLWYGLMEAAKDELRAERSNRLLDKIHKPAEGDVLAFGTQR